MVERHLYRSVKDRKIAGVAGGLAEYLNVDSTIVRLVWLISVLIGGTGFLAYIIAWIVIPEAQTIPESESEPVNLDSNRQSPTSYPLAHQKRLSFLGIFLIFLGIYFLLKIFLPWSLSQYLGPVLLIGIGLLLLIPRHPK